MLRHPIYGQYILPVYLPAILISLGQLATLILLPLYVLELGGNVAQASLVAAARGCGMLLADLPAGVIAARYGPRHTMIGAIAMSIIASAALVWTTEIIGIAIANLIFGMATSLLMISRQSYVTALSSSWQRGRIMAVLAACFRVSGLLGPVLGGLGAEILGYRTVFGLTILTTASGLMMTFLFAGKVEGKIDSTPGRTTGGAILARLGSIARTHARILAKIGVAYISIMILRHGNSLLVPLFGHQLGLSVAAIGLIISIASLVDLALFYPAGRIMDGYGRRYTAVPAMLIMSVAIALMPLSGGFYALLAVVMLFGFGNGIATGVFLTIGSDIAPENNRSEFLGLWRVIGDSGGLASPLLIGVLTGIATLAAATSVIALIGITGMVVMVTLVPETLKRRE
jgi:MFS family permease